MLTYSLGFKEHISIPNNPHTITAYLIKRRLQTITSNTNQHKHTYLPIIEQFYFLKQGIYKIMPTEIQTRTNRHYWEPR